MQPYAICEMVLAENEAAAFKKAVDRHYWWEGHAAGAVAVAVVLWGSAAAVAVVLWGGAAMPLKDSRPLKRPNTPATRRFDLYMDDLPMWGFVGERRVDWDGSPRLLIYQHMGFNISYNGNQARGGRGGRGPRTGAAAALHARSSVPVLQGPAGHGTG